LGGGITISAQVKAGGVLNIEAGGSASSGGCYGYGHNGCYGGNSCGGYGYGGGWGGGDWDYGGWGCGYGGWGGGDWGWGGWGCGYGCGGGGGYGYGCGGGGYGGGSSTSAGIGIDDVISAGGTEIIGSAGATGSAAVEYGGTVLSGGTALVFSDGVYSGGTVAGLLSASSGADVNYTTILTGGTEVVTLGGSTVSVTLSGGALNLSGGKASAAVIDSAGVLKVFYSGLTVSATINSGGLLVVSSGGTESGTTTSSGGTLIVRSGGSDPYAQIKSGGVLVDSGTGLGDTVSAGGTLVVATGGSETNGVVLSGGTEIIQSGGADFHTFVASGGTQIFASGGSGPDGIVAGVMVVSGSNSSDTVVSGGTEIVVSGGIENAGTVESGGTVIVSNGGLLSASLIEGGARVIVLSGGMADANTFEPGGVLIVRSGGIDPAPFSSGAVGVFYNSGSGVIIVAGGTVGVLGAGDQSDVIVSGGTLVVAGGAAADGYTSGGTVSGSIISSGGTMLVDGAVTSGDTFFPAFESGQIASYVNALGSGNTIFNGGKEVVGSGGTARGDKVLAGASVVLSGGTFVVSSGATVSAPITFASGTSGSDLVLNSVTNGMAVLGGEAISGFPSGGDTIDLTGVAYTSGATMTVVSSGVAVLSANGNTYTFDLPGIAGPDLFTLKADGGAGLDITGYAPCFLTGTRIATPEGEVAVEDLHEDDLVLTASGKAKPVRWIGYRHVIAAELPDAHLYAPIVIEAGAIAEGKPARDLFVTPDHAIFVEGRLVPVKLLVNGTTIRQEPRAEYSFYHLELDRHDLLLAEGLEAESYLDVAASRQRFANNGVTDLALDLSLTDLTEAAYAERGVMPLSLREDAVKPVWDAIAARAAALAPQAGFTQDPALHLLVAGAAVQPAKVEGARYLFPVAGSVAEITIASRHTSPWAAKPWIDDRRELGVAVASVTVMSDTGLAEVPLAGGAAVSGWYGLERDAEGRTWRWTNGAGVIALPPGARWVEVTLQGTLEYPAGDRGVLWMAEAV
jgi:autotransporter passenger strand-loop-strand repeat protein